MVDIGRLNRRVTFLCLTEKENDIGETTLILTPYKTVWATVSPKRGREYLDAAKITSEVAYSVIIRYRTDITPDMAIQYGGKLLDIQAVMNPRGDNEMLEIICVERMPNNGARF